MSLKPRFISNTKIRLLFVSTSYPATHTSWQGRFIYDLIFALAKYKELEISYWGPSGDMPESIRYVATLEEKKWLDSLSEAGGIAKSLKSNLISKLGNITILLYYLRRLYTRSENIHVAHVNWLQNAIPLYGIRIPLLVTVLGSDYRILQQPYLGSSLLLRKVFKQRKSIISPNSLWMTQSLNTYFSDVAHVEPVLFGVDKAWFDTPHFQKSNKKPEWLIISRVTKDKIGTLFEWCRNIADTNIFHLFGPKQENIVIPDWIQYHGPTHPSAIRNEWFPRATGLLSTSLHMEGRPQIILEAMAAGVPVVASNIPGHSDIIVHGKTGFLVQSQAELEKTILKLSMDQELWHEVATQAKTWLIENVGTWSDCANRYIDKYAQLMR